MPTIARRFTVPRRGTGKPDFVQATKPSRETITTKSAGEPTETPIESQKTWRDLWDGDINGDSMMTVEAYTVPEGWRLFMGGGFVSCDAPQEPIQLIKLIATPGMLGDFWYKLRGDIILAGHAIMAFEAGTTLTYYIYNKDSTKHHFSISLLGTLERA
ncbi:hypothetical protein ES703_114034 [subsurface metagenome]